jgi:hypothetical protein
MLDTMVADGLDEGYVPKLPAKGSSLLKTLLALVELQQADSTQLTELLNNGVEQPYRQKDVSSYLYALKARGFVVQTEERKRKAGGSIWMATLEAQELLKE